MNIGKMLLIFNENLLTIGTCEIMKSPGPLKIPLKLLPDFPSYIHLFCKETR